MFAVVQIGSDQFKVSEGDLIAADRMTDEEGKSVTLDKVLVFAKGADIRIGKPFLKEVKVQAKVVSHVLDDKVTAFKYRNRKDSASKIGHRQQLTALSIEKITA
ncbi:MAG: 50S ribosomal protein L21 [Candidatus Omnitrophica bacterium]|nr:50S ribosomal protein L21 [Candidatus Omnitrophota bacterium]